MTSLQSIKTDMKRLKQGRTGKLIVCFEGQPIPKHRPEDTLVIFEEGDDEVF